MLTTRRAEHRIAALIAKHQADGQQDWRAKWISFQAIAQYCATLRTPRKSAAGQAGERFAYAKLMEAIEAGEFNVSGRTRVLLVPQGGKILRVNASELLEAREAFEPEIFRMGYMERCWAPANLIVRWFAKHRIPSPWAQEKGTLRVGRARPVGAIDHARDLEVIGRALEIRHEHRISGRKEPSIRNALTTAINKEGSKKNKAGEETDRLRSKLRKRLKLRKSNRRA
jgi:hypothetical protein